VIDFYI